MKTVSVVASKGGVGKSTIVANLAVAAALQYPEARIGMIDADPQGCLARWWSKRSGSALELFVSDGQRLVEHARALTRGGLDLLFIDTPPGLSPFQREAASAADLVLVPTGPSAVDLEAIEAAEGIIRAVGRVPLFVLNRAGFRTRVAGAAVRRLAEEGRRLIGVLHARVDVAEAMERGRGAIEHWPTGAAAREMLELWNEVSRALGPLAPEPLPRAGAGSIRLWPVVPVETAPAQPQAPPLPPQFSSVPKLGSLIAPRKL